MSPDTRYPRRRSIRLKNYNYVSPGIYFVTMCTRDRRLYFEDAWLHDLAGTIWQAIPEHFSGVRLDEWVVMPNHVHGLLVFEPIDEQDSAKKAARHRSLPVVIRTYKGAVTTACRQARRTFAWQENYYEHVVRGENDLDNIRRYIRDNPLKWELDAENPINSNRSRQ